MGEESNVVSMTPPDKDSKSFAERITGQNVRDYEGPPLPSEVFTYPLAIEEGQKREDMVDFLNHWKHDRYPYDDAPGGVTNTIDGLCVACLEDEGEFGQLVRLSIDKIRESGDPAQAAADFIALAEPVIQQYMPPIDEHVSHALKDRLLGAIRSVNTEPTR